MLVAEIFGATLLLSMIVALSMLAWMCMHTGKYFNKNNTRYSEVTFGGSNPLNALFYSDLLSDDGIRFRTAIWKVLALIFTLFIVSEIFATMLEWKS